MSTESAADRADELRVTPLELFFDLVFVFTVTQLTDSLAHHLTPGGMTRVVVMLAIIWWMYDAFIWLANAMPPKTHSRRGLHLLGMGAFLVIALTVPHAFEGDGWAFGWAYLVVVVLHTGMFAATGVPAGSVARMGAFNAAGAGLVLVGGYLSASAQLALWVAAFAWTFANPYLVNLPTFRIEPRHFVERHGLVVIVAFGESVIAIGVGAGNAHLSFPLLSAALLCLVVCFGLWWAYFGHDDDEAAADFMTGLDDARRNHLGVRIYNFGHYLLLLGVLLAATGAKSAVAHPTDALGTAQAVALAGGVALFLAANLAIRRTVGRQPLLPRTCGVLLVLLAIPLGAQGAAQAELSALVLVLAGVFGYEEYAAGTLRDRLSAGGAESPVVVSPVADSVVVESGGAESRGTRSRVAEPRAAESGVAESRVGGVPEPE